MPKPADNKPTDNKPIKEDGFVPTNLDKDFKASANKLTELKAGRDVGDIPLNDEYWIALKKHNEVHGK